MKIYVEKVLDEVVYFSTDYGNAKGIWKGNNRPIDKVYYVEMDIDMLCDYESFVLCDTKEYHIEMVDGNIQITLLLLEYEEDGCATFQFGDTIIEIETNFDERFYALKNCYLTINVEKMNKLATTTSSGGLLSALQRAIVTARPKGRYRKHLHWSATKRYFLNLLFLILLPALLYIFELLHQ